jgi:hypothetical protein
MPFDRVQFPCPVDATVFSFSWLAGMLKAGEKEERTVIEIRHKETGAILWKGEADTLAGADLAHADLF